MPDVKLVALKWDEVVGFSVETDGEQDDRGVLFENVMVEGFDGWSAEDAWAWAQRICNAVNQNQETQAVIQAAQALASAQHHLHGDRCYGTYEPCGEHHVHDGRCGSRPLICGRSESGPLVNRLYAALNALDTAQAMDESLREGA